MPHLPFRPACLGCIILLGFSSLAAGQAGRSKAPVPDEAAQAEIMKTAKEVFGEEYAGAKTADARRTLVRKILQKADESKDAPSRFVLMKLAREVAVRARDGLTAFQIIDDMGDAFQINRLAMKADVLGEFAEMAKGEEEHRSVLDKAFGLLDDAVAAEDFVAAARFSELAQVEAKKVKDKALIKRSADRVAEVEELTKAYEEVRRQEPVLDKNPADPQANLIVGKFRCFACGDWERGAPMLALGNDAALKNVAAKELDEPTAAADQAAIADAWWGLAEKQEGRVKQQMLRRAGTWYRKAIPRLEGLARGKAEKRVQEGEVPATAGVSAAYLDDLKETSSSVTGRLGKHGASSYTDEELYQSLLYRNQVPAHALATRPASQGSATVTYNLKGEYGSFVAVATVGVPSDVATFEGMDKLRDLRWQGRASAPLMFKIYGDNRQLWQSRILQKAGDTQNIRVSVRNMKTLKLVVECRGDNAFADALWVDPLISK